MLRTDWIPPFFAIMMSLLTCAAHAQTTHTGTIVGTVYDPLGRLVSGAQITVLDTLQAEVSDTDGAFTIAGIPAGSHTVEASLVGYVAVQSTNVVIAPSEATTIVLRFITHSMTPTGITTVRVPVIRKGLATHQGSSQTVVTAQGIEQIAAPTSLNNVLEATVPGAIALPSGALRIRGSDNQYSYYLDGAPLPANISASLTDQINPKTINTLRLYAGGIPAAYGGQLAAVIDVTAKSGRSGSPQGFVQQFVGGASTFETTASFGGAKGPLSYFLSGFRSSTDFGLSPPARNSLHNHAWQNNGFAKLDFQSNASDRYTLHLGAQSASLQIPNTPDRQSVGQDDRQRETKNLVHMIWQHFEGPKTLRLAAYSHDERVRFDPSPADLVDALGWKHGAEKIEASVGALSSTYQDQYARYLGLRGDYTVPSAGSHRVQFGFEVNRVTGYQDFHILYPEGSGTEPVMDARRLSGGNRGVYVQDDWTQGRFLVNYGVRYDVHKAENTTSQISPRLNVTYTAGKKDTVHAFYNRLYMPVPVENVNFLTGAGSTGDATRIPIRPERQHYFEAGVEHQAGKTTVSADAYWRIARDIVDNEALGDTPIEVSINEARGIVKGVEIAVDHTFSPAFAAYASYARSVGLARGPIVGGFLGAADFPSGYFHDDHDLPNVATAELAYQGRRLSAMLTGRYSSGFPYGEIADENGNPVQVNYLRLPSHFTVDAVVETRGGKGTEMALFVTNAFNNRYVITQDSPFRNERWARGRAMGFRLTRTF